MPRLEGPEVVACERALAPRAHFCRAWDAIRGTLPTQGVRGRARVAVEATARKHRDATDIIERARALWQ
jgi:hypothetical protein